MVSVSQDKGFDIIEEVLREHYGDAYKPEVPRTNGARRDPDSESPYDQINELAMGNLDAWVRDLGIYKLRPQRGRYRSFVGVAQWRESSTAGRSLEGRDCNLKICQSGIKDFGDGRTYTPIDLVMAALNLDDKQALDWLDQKLGWSKGGPGLDVEACKAKQAERDEHVVEGPWPGSRTTSQEEETTENGDPVPPKELGQAWHFGDPVPPQQPMLVPDLIPLKGYGNLGGQWGTFKTFITDDLAVAVASAGQFAGRQVTARGAVVMIELEGTHTEKRLHAAATYRKVADARLPIVHLRAEPPTIMIGGKPNKAWPKWSARLVEYAKKFAAARDVPLAIIVIDPQNSVAGFRDEQSSAEGQIVSNAWWKLSRDAGCLVLVTDHLGKDPQAGLRGTSAKETNPLFILSTGATKKDAYSKRELEVRKMRNGRAGVAVTFSMGDQEIELRHCIKGEGGTESQETVKEKTLVVHWEGELHQVGESGGDDEVSTLQRRALTVLAEMIAGRAGEQLPEECEAPAGLRGVLLDSWRLRLINKTVLEGKNTSAAFSQIKNALLDKKQIDIGDGYVWIPIMP